jgi:DNA polymerase-3 subunit epsilon
MNWVSGKLVGLDLETTSTDIEDARIVTVALVTLDGGEVVDVWEQLADPGIEIPAGATATHGITTEVARAQGQPADAVIAETLRRFAANGPRTPVVIMNARYDLTVLDREARRRGLTHLLPDFFPGLIVDPLVIDRHLDRFRRGSRRLPDLCEAYGVELEQAHSATADATAAARLARVMCTSGRVVRGRYDEDDAHARREADWLRLREDAAGLFAAERFWARGQRAEFARYLRTHADDEAADAVEQERWPLQPLASEPEE